MRILTRGMKRRSVWLVFGSVLIIAGMAAATTLLFTQTFPSIAQGGMTEGCSTLTADNFITIAPTEFVNFDCAGPAAFTTVTAAFLLPRRSCCRPGVRHCPSSPPVPESPGSACNGQAGYVSLTSGSAVNSLIAAHSYDYCLGLNPNTASVLGFSVTWVQ